LLLSEAFDVYILLYVIPYQAVGTVRVFQRAKLSICKEDLKLEDLTTEDILNWQNNLSKTCSINTVRLYTEKLRKVLAYHHALGNKCISPHLVHSPKGKISRIEWLTPCEVKSFIDEALKKRHGRSMIGRYRNAAIIALLYSSGMRVHELTSLDRDCIVNGKSITIIGKGGKQGIVFVDKRSIYLINQYLSLREDNNEAMFVTLQGERLCTDKIREVFSCTSRHFSKKVHPHMLRHSFATNLLENGCHPYTMQRLMRHSTFLSTQKYLHIVDKELEQAHNKYHK
jgi:site-specific recombinase XerD